MKEVAIGVGGVVVGAVGMTFLMKHLAHHDDLSINFGFGVDAFDKAFGTFKATQSPPPVREG